MLGIKKLVNLVPECVHECESCEVPGPHLLCSLLLALVVLRVPFGLSQNLYVLSQTDWFSPEQPLRKGFSRKKVCQEPEWGDDWRGAQQVSPLQVTTVFHCTGKLWQVVGSVWAMYSRHYLA